MWYDNKITKDRFDALCILVKEKKNKIVYKDFTCSELEIIIDETPITEKDKEIARMKYIQRLTNEEILEKLNYYSLNTIKTHIKRITLELRSTCNKLFI